MLSPGPVLSGISCIILPYKCLETPSMADMGYLATGSCSQATTGVTWQLRIPSLKETWFSQEESSSKIKVQIYHTPGQVSIELLTNIYYGQYPIDALIVVYILL